MKITKEQLKQIIKEELEMIMQKEKNMKKDVMEIYRDGIDPQAAAEKLATMYSFRDCSGNSSICFFRCFIWEYISL